MKTVLIPEYPNQSAPEQLDAFGVSGNAWPSKEFVRRTVSTVDKFELAKLTVGLRYALQDHRAIYRLHTTHPGERGELDYTKYLVWLYPNTAWKEPLLYQTGLGVDHMSEVIKGYLVTFRPTAATAIRLYKHCVLPKRLWLPEHLQGYANEWDVVGLDRLVALDNAKDLQARSALMMFIAYGVIVLCVPPRRGDLKGTIERTNQSIERMFIEQVPGYVPMAYPFTDPRMDRIKKAAKKQAKLTVAEYEKLLLLAILEYNNAKHPRFRKRRIDVYRDGLEVAPPVLPTGLRHIRSTFALTFKGHKVTREGVLVDGLKYNSAELNELYRTGVKHVDVKLDPDDVRTAHVYSRELFEPIEVTLTTFKFPEATSLEVARNILGVGPDGSDKEDDEDEGDETPPPNERFVQELYELQNAPGPRRGRKRHLEADAAVQGARMAPVEPPKKSTIDDAELVAMFRGSGGA